MPQYFYLKAHIIGITWVVVAMSILTVLKGSFLDFPDAIAIVKKMFNSDNSEKLNDKKTKKEDSIISDSYVLLLIGLEQAFVCMLFYLFYGLVRELNFFESLFGCFGNESYHD